MALEVFASELSREAQALSRSLRCNRSEKGGEERSDGMWHTPQERVPVVVNTLSIRMSAV